MKYKVKILIKVLGLADTRTCDFLFNKQDGGSYPVQPKKGETIADSQPLNYFPFKPVSWTDTCKLYREMSLFTSFLEGPDVLFYNNTNDSFVINWFLRSII